MSDKFETWPKAVIECVASRRSNIEVARSYRAKFEATIQAV
jgi:hypothetical protein